MMNRLLAASAACLSLGLAPLAGHAAMTFTSYGVALPSGEHLVTDFSTSDGPDRRKPGDRFGERPVCRAGASARSTFDTAQYLEVPGGQSATLDLRCRRRS